MPFLADEIRDQFPSLWRLAPSGRQPIFFDNPAGTQTPLAVIDAVSQYYREMNANSGGFFHTSRATDDMAYLTRQAMADFLNAPSPDEIVIGPNMTTLSFALSRAIGKVMEPGDEIIVTRLDHDANITPWLSLAARHELEVKRVDIRAEDCTLDMASLEAALSERTSVIATAHASNAVGSVTPLRQIADMAHAVDAVHVVDAVQSAPHLPLDVVDLDCDFLLCSAYKFYGPHLGILWGRARLLNGLPVERIRPMKNVAPDRWETGTPSYETWNGLRACLNYWASLGERFGDAHLPQFSGERLQMKRGMLAVRDYEGKLARRLIDGFLSIKGVEIAGITDPARLDQRVPTVAFVKDGLAPDDIAKALAAQDIYVWSGDYYAPEIMRRLNRPEGMVRVGIAQYNTAAEVDALLDRVEAL